MLFIESPRNSAAGSRRACALALVLAGAFTAVGAVAADGSGGSIKVEHAHARATVPGQPTGGGYLTIVSRGAADRLTAVSSPIAAAVELHRMKMEGDVMHMREVDGIDIPAGATVSLQPGGYHLMLTGLKSPLTAGTHFPLTLTFAKAGRVTVDAVVEAPGAAR